MRSGDKGAVGIPFKADVSSSAEIQAMFEKISEEVGPVDILINNAGITRDMLTMMMKPTDFTDVINLNLNGKNLTCNRTQRPQVSNASKFYRQLAQFVVLHCNFSTYK